MDGNDTRMDYKKDDKVDSTPASRVQEYEGGQASTSKHFLVGNHCYPTSDFN